MLTPQQILKVGRMMQQTGGYDARTADDHLPKMKKQKPGHINIEIKAHCAAPNEVRDYLRQHNAVFKGTDHQIDTYFNVPEGRLKLREGNIENCLIFYERDDQKGPKQSNVILHPNQRESTLKALLTTALGIHVVVDKQRDIYFIDNVKFHVDEVKDLGSFVEIEAIDQNGALGKKKLQTQCNHYLKELEIKKKDLISKSYSDMLLALRKP